ncbi:hypothetical protein DFH08DRAFT_809031 [Mycena albidolilacea]|uniref:Uncharacterized protein n=1 Tax=Mycena albidolilacea TaxID=1033008 RepID=A0AAD7A0S4_9AGAR|nr:hypothetical protein DFH08DRAFT_809031 [Mycena albidolilacea]
MPFSAPEAPIHLCEGTPKDANPRETHQPGLEAHLALIAEKFYASGTVPCNTYCLPAPTNIQSSTHTSMGLYGGSTTLTGNRNPGRERSAACTRTTATLQREVPKERKTSSVLVGMDGYKRAKSRLTVGSKQVADQCQILTNFGFPASSRIFRILSARGGVWWMNTRVWELQVVEQRENQESDWEQGRTEDAEARGKVPNAFSDPAKKKHNNEAP